MHSKKGKQPILKFKQKIRPLDIIIFTRHLSTLISAGIPLIHAIDFIGQGHHNIQMKKILFQLKMNLSEGLSFADSLKKCSEIFDQFYCQLIRASEQSGTLELMLKRIALNLEQSASLRKKINKALAYPISIIGLSLIVSFFLLFTIVPQFEIMFRSFNAKLPTITCVILQISRTLEENGILFISILFSFLLTIKLAYKYLRSRTDLVDKCILKCPVIGSIIEKIILAKLSRTFSILLSAGTPLVESLNSTSNTINNLHFRNALIKISTQVVNGHSLHQALSQNAFFPQIFNQMIAAGEISGSLPTLLDKLANFYEEDLDQIISNLNQILQPMIMLILGLLIGLFVVAMYLPIFNLGSIF